MRTLEEMNRIHEASEAARAYFAFGVACVRCSPDSPDLVPHFKSLLPRSSYLPNVQKAAVGGIGTDELDPLQSMRRAFVELVGRRTLIGQMLGVRRVPSLTRMQPVADGATAAFVIEGSPIAAAAIDFGESFVMTPGKIAVILIFTRELVFSTEPLAFQVMERDTTRAIATGENAALLDGAAAVPAGRPASILYGVTPIVGGIEAAVAELVETVSGGESESPYFITSMRGAMHLAQQRGAADERIFPNVTATGGNIHGIPVLISPEADEKLVLLDAAQLIVSEAGIEIERSAQAALQMQTEPGSGAQQLVSLWQNNLLALKAIRYIDWRLGSADAVAYIELGLGSPA